MRRLSFTPLRAAAAALLLFVAPYVRGAAEEPAADLFQQGCQAYLAGGFEQAAAAFREAAAKGPSAPILHNLGNAEWQSRRTGPAILSWERALWLNPYSANTRANLRFARKTAQLDTPELAWHEVCSTWLPTNAWAWLAMFSFWTALALVILPSVLRWRKADWHQGLAAACFAVFLLTLPALAGVHSRARLGILLERENPLRLTPTREGQVLTRVPGGDMARMERERGKYVYVRTSAGAGWVDGASFGRIGHE